MTPNAIYLDPGPTLVPALSSAADAPASTPARIVPAVEAEAELDFETFVLRYGAELLGFARRVTVDCYIAEDVVQDALERCSRSWDRIAAMGNPRAYVYRAVINSAHSWRRRRRLNELPADEALGRMIDERAGIEIPTVNIDSLRRGLLTLSLKQRTALVLRYYLDYADVDIAKATGWPLATVRSHTRRGLARMRATLNESEGELL